MLVILENSDLPNTLITRLSLTPTVWFSVIKESMLVSVRMSFGTVKKILALEPNVLLRFLFNTYLLY